MAINKSEQSLEDQLVNRVKSLEDQMLTLKTSVQPIGADMMDIRPSNTAIASGLVVAANSAINVVYTLTPVSDFVLFLTNTAFTVFIDVVAVANKYPDGSSLTTAQKNLVIVHGLDYQDSLDVSPYSRTYKFRLFNNDSSSHTYNLYIETLYPKLTTS